MHLLTFIPNGSKYFMYFPDNYQHWSAEVLAMISTATYGGAEIAEVDRIGPKLRGRVGDDAAWFEVLTESGDLLHRRAEAAKAERHPFTAAPNYLRACAHYQRADHFRQPKDDRTMAALLACQASSISRQELQPFRRRVI